MYLRSLLFTAHECHLTSKYDPEGTGIGDEDLSVEEEEAKHIPHYLPQHHNERTHHPGRETNSNNIQSRQCHIVSCTEM